MLQRKMLNPQRGTVYECASFGRVDGLDLLNQCFDLRNLCQKPDFLIDNIFFSCSTEESKSYRFGTS